jgi:cytochrome c-type protein NapB
MSDSPSPAVSPPPKRLAPVLGALAIGLATLGFVAGMREQPFTARPTSPQVQETGLESVPRAVPYPRLAEDHPRPNARWQSQLATLKSDIPDPFAPVVRTEELKQQALADRAVTRSFDGAPPTIPHPVEQQSDANCLACHGQGAKIGERIASRMSHALLTNCTQCHVATAPFPFARAREPIETDFVGVYRAGAGERAWTGAPPAIPHATWMRQDCASCHGLIARPGLRTTHIWRTNCTQCHAASAILDQTALEPPFVSISTADTQPLNP